ncbi:MAG TPA: 50S ribosomal protein L21 [bacterium]|nr:50S ribosomal protein L21 [bacterium]HEX68063.1 50S ribosomal protein L21 [bacterium]
MKAIIKTGGKEYLVEEGEIIEVERLSKQPGEKVIFEEVLAVGEKGKMDFGNPLVKGAKVEAEVLEEIKGEKKIAFKYRPKTNWHWKKGHRQIYTRIRITRILDGKGKGK